MDAAFEQKISFEKKFNKVFREIRSLESKIHKKEGIWIFKTHVYSQSELTEHQVKIDSFTSKIGDDAVSWNRFGQLTQEAREVYEVKNDEVMHELNRLYSEIKNREDTWWEGVQSEFNKFIVKIVKNMPGLAKGLLGFSKPIPRLPPGDK